VIEYKARICARGFCQTLRLNFDQKYTPTGKATSLRLLLSFAINNNLQIHQLDVKSAFLTCPLEDKVTLFPPHGFVCPPNSVLQLKKAIYGLKKASEEWHKRLSGFIISIGFIAMVSNSCVFNRKEALSQPVWNYSF
jgi:hypothetical protein